MHQQNRLATVVPVAIILVVATIVIRVLNTSDDDLRSSDASARGNESTLSALNTDKTETPDELSNFGSNKELEPFRPIESQERSEAINFPAIDPIPELAIAVEEKVDETANDIRAKQSNLVNSVPQVNDASVKTEGKIVNQHVSIETNDKPVSVFRRNDVEQDTATNGPAIGSNDDGLELKSQPAKDLSFKVSNVDTDHSMKIDNGGAFKDTAVKNTVVKDTAVKKTNAVRQYRGLPGNVVNQAFKRIEYGSSLARRGAVYGASQEFVAALRSIAEACDIQQNSGNEHIEALSLGLIALRETQDFATLNQQLDIGAALSAIVSSHRSGVLSAEEVKTMNASSAIQAYFKFAQQKITSACGPFPISSYAFYSLGKLHTMNHKMNVGDDVYDQAKSIVMHRAALIADPNNFKSANELGVILAQCGQLDDARKILQHGLAVHPTVDMWNNLAVVHEQAGDPRMANAARNESRILAESNQRQQQATSQVQWVAHETFEQNAQAPPLTTGQNSPQAKQPENQPMQRSGWPNQSNGPTTSRWPQ